MGIINFNSDEPFFVQMFEEIGKISKEEMMPKIEDFVKKDDNGIQLNDGGIKKYFSLYEERMGNLDGDKPGLRKEIDNQIVKFKKYLMDKISFSYFSIKIED